MTKTEDEAYNLIEEMTLNNFQWSTERGQPKRVGGKLEFNVLTLLSAKVDAVTQRLDRMNVNAVNSSAPSPYKICGSIEHVILNCQVGVLFPKTLVKLTMFKTSTREWPITLILIHIIPVGRVIRISPIGIIQIHQMCPL